MELYYKDLISEEASLEKLVDELMLIVQGADEFVRANGATFQGPQKEEITTLLQRLKDRCQRVQRQAVASALAIDKVLHQYPYSALGFAFAFGLLAGKLFNRKS
jgi:ElaB/YqjD/DUF883 family membrane-anchored ribosome-binding protein